MWLVQIGVAYGTDLYIVQSNTNSVQFVQYKAIGATKAYEELGIGSLYRPR